MSFPTIPDINPKINVTKEDAVVLLLISIALEEISLSDLIDAESKKIKSITHKCGCNEVSVQDLKDINNSVNKTIKDIIKLQMLLQFKLEDVMEIVCPTTTTTSSTTTTTSTTTSTTTTTTTATATTTTSTTTSTTSSTSTTTCRKCDCRLTGRGCGTVYNNRDQFFNGTAVIQACVCELCEHIKDSTLYYCVQKDNVQETLKAFAYSLEIECPSAQYPNRIVIKGLGAVSKIERTRKEISDVGRFTLTVWDNGSWSVEDRFEMVISVEGKPELNHSSGIINATKSSLLIRSCDKPQ